MNCDEAEKIGAEIQQSLDDVQFKISKIKRRGKVKAMASPKRPNDTDFPFSGFGHERKRYRIMIAFAISDLAFQKWNNEGSKKIKGTRVLTKNVNQTELLGAAVHVLDRGALLHLVQWLYDTTYCGVIRQHREYLLAAFIVLVFLMLTAMDQAKKILNIKFEELNYPKL